MLQDIEPKRFHNEYAQRQDKPSDLVLHFNEQNEVLIQPEEKTLFPTVGQWINCEGLQYLFSIDDTQYYLSAEKLSAEVPAEKALHVNVKSLRQTAEKIDCFAAATAYHLYVWYRDNRYCGRCGQKLIPDTKERMLHCEHCKNMVYPKIAPAVIVGIIDKDRILMTKYAGRDYKKYALVAGFTEIGETAEETVKREVWEEVGLRVRDITYYKSQPWGFDSNLLLGFFARAEGTDSIEMDKEELAAAEWVLRENAKNMDDEASLTRNMMEYFYRMGEEQIFA